MIKLSNKDTNPKNPIFINEITLKNYRTYDALTIEFKKNIHTLVGPNECGKTNLLLAFESLSNPNILQDSDTCCYVEDIFETKPEIEFKFNIDKIKNLISNLDINKLKVKIEGKNRTIETPEKINLGEAGYKISFHGTLPTGQIHITLPEIIENISLPSNHHIEQNKTYQFATNSKEIVDKVINYFASHQHKQNIVFKVDDILMESSENTILDTLLENVKLINWSFKDEYYIPSKILLTELQSNVNKYRSIDNFFKIANINLSDFIKTNDQGRRINILRRVNQKVSKILNESWTQYQDIKLNLYLGTDNALYIGFLENEQTIDPKRRSLGFQWFFAFLLHFNANFGNELKNCVILLDEPGIYLHPGGQKDLLKEIEKLSLYNQIIYTTHLPFMINRNHPERIIFLNKEEGITKLRQPRKEGIFDDVLLSNTLGFSFSSISNFGEVNLFVEGITDKILIEELAINYAKKNNEDLLDLNYISIIPINGINNLDSFIRVAQESNINFIALIDNDDEGSKKYKKYKKNPEKYQNAIDFLFILEKNKEIEDLIPFEIIKRTFKELQKSIEPWNILIANNVYLEDKKITPQIKQIINNIKERDKNGEFDSKLIEDINISNLSAHQLKLDLFILLKKYINEENCQDFADLIKILKKINSKSSEIIRKMRL